jgi:predicted CoA-substrate-specific enzyme activase
VTPSPLYVGIDVGASRTKAAILDGRKNLVGYAVARSGTDFNDTADKCLESALAMAGAGRQDIARTVSSGYGKNNVSFSQETRTEIACHAKGCFHYFPLALTIIDIGGQDNKIIKIDPQGRRTNFKMNRKCAAGTGAFLEEMSLRLDIPIEEMDDLARQSTAMVTIGSYCTVFSATEVLTHIRQGKSVPDIVKGVFHSMIRRVLEMDLLTENVAMSGGVVEHNPYLVTMAEEIIGKKILVSDHPQLAGAIGAALYAIDTDPDG